MKKKAIRKKLNHLKETHIKGDDSHVAPLIAKKKKKAKRHQRIQKEKHQLKIKKSSLQKEEKEI